MKNSDKFLSAFNRIDKYLERFQSGDSYITFTQKIKKSESRNAIVRRYKDILLEFADLRNAIVHELTNPVFVIAEPNNWAVEQIEQIESELLKPKTVIPVFQKKVTHFQASDSLAELLTEIRDKDYSQFPIYDGANYLGLITENGITSWMAKNVEEDLIQFSQTKLSEILPHIGEEGNYQFISRNESIYIAEEKFKESFKKGIRLDALLITHNGKPTENLLGIITTWDVIEIPKHELTLNY
ncbi:CBS domain-containing protein [Fictibacillus phosphorivorans]|uniref:CBS domain-containing protein n=1 Tax=Fictibacillus phosphorivorans TaxID=1221500 RepID=UPI003CF91FB8